MNALPGATSSPAKTRTTTRNSTRPSGGYTPRDGIEEVLVHQLVNLSWRIRRLEHGAAVLEWYKFNCSDVDFQRRDEIPAPPQAEEEWEQYRLGRSLQDLTDSDRNCYTVLSRYTTSLYRAHSQALRDLETRRRMAPIHPCAIRTPGDRQRCPKRSAWTLVPVPANHRPSLQPSRPGIK